MFAALGRFTVRRRWWVVSGAVIFCVLAGVWGTGAFGRLTGGAGFEDRGSESVRADRLLDGPLGRYGPDVVVLYDSPDRTVDQYAGEVRQAVAAVPRDGIARLETYWTAHDPAFVSIDRRATYVTVQFAAGTDQQHVAALKSIEQWFRAPGLRVRFGGVTAMTEQVNARTGADIARAEMFSVPLLLILLVLIFRGFMAAALPLAVGGIVALGSFAVLRALTSVTNISTFAINTVTILGLGLAIDYALFMSTGSARSSAVA